VTDRQRLAKLQAALRALKQTTHGYTPEGVHWRTAMTNLRALQLDLQQPPPPSIPQLGPILLGGKSVLLHDLTHMTAMPAGPNRGRFPALDDGFGDIGRSVIAPEALKITGQSGSQGGDAFYAKGESGIEYWVGHIDRAPSTGARFRKGERMCRIAWISQGDGGPHVHLGIDARPLIGRTLTHHTNYTHGAPTVGRQLAEALA